MLKEYASIKNMLNENRKEGNKYLRFLQSENRDIEISIIEGKEGNYFHCTLRDKNGNSVCMFQELLFENQKEKLLSLDFDIVE